VIILETERLLLRTASLDDAEFMLRLLNEPSFLRFVGDRGVRTADDARGYIADRLIAGYEKNGYGLWVVELEASGTPIGISGLVRRDTLPDADIGFAFLPEYWGQGYAYESTVAAVRYALGELALPRLLAITDQDNVASIRLLERLGLSFERMIQLADDAAELRLFAISNG
jgi:RimJ/RimL family protein N-acetyltransferase